MNQNNDPTECHCPNVCDKHMDPKMRKQRLHLTKRLIDGVPSEHIPALENFVSSLLPPLEGDPVDPDLVAAIEKKLRPRSGTVIFQWRWQ